MQNVDRFRRKTSLKLVSSSFFYLFQPVYFSYVALPFSLTALVCDLPIKMISSTHSFHPSFLWNSKYFTPILFHAFFFLSEKFNSWEIWLTKWAKRIICSIAISKKRNVRDNVFSTCRLFMVESLLRRIKNARN